MRRDVRGRVVLVTGASRGIGKRSAQRLAKLGPRLALTSRSAEELDKIASELRAAGTEVETFPADLTKPEDRSKMVEAVIQRFGGLDVLLNSAGVCSFGEFSSSSEEIARRVLEVNFFAQVELIRLCVPHLTRCGDRGGQPAIVNVASLCGRWGIPSLSEHSASKHALVGLSEALQSEFERFGIDVLLVLPALVQSDDLNRHLLRNEGKIYLDFEHAQPSDDVAAVVVNGLLRNRTESTTGFVSWGVCLFRRLFPRSVRFFMQRKVWKFAKRNG